MSAPRAPRCLQQLRCDGPEVEIAAVARELRKRRCPTTVVVPATAVSRWVDRLRHRDIPLRGWISRPAATTPAGRVVVSIVAVVRDGRASLPTLRDILFGAALRPWVERAEVGGDETLDAIEEGRGATARYGSVLSLFDQLRRQSGTLAEWKKRVEHVAARRVLEIERKASADDDNGAYRADRVNRVNADAKALVDRLERLASLKTGADLSSLLADWRYRQTALGRGSGTAEASAALTALLVIREHAADALPSLHDRLVSALREAAAGEWIDETSSTGPVVEIIPYDGVLEPTSNRIILTGLDAEPMPPPRSALLCEPTVAGLGLPTATEGYREQLRRLDRLAEHPDCLLSWRARDGVGAVLSPGPWVATRVTSDDVHGVGLIELASPESDSIRCDLERDVVAPSSPQLRAAIDAIASHGADAIGPHTGALGVSVAPREYSVSALQSFAKFPYQYFIERVLGVGEDEASSDDLDAMEAGVVVHAALERALRALLRAGPVDLKASADEIGVAIQTEVAKGVREAAEHSLAAPVWEGIIARWQEELAQWWKDRRKQLEGTRVHAVELGFGGRHGTVEVPLGDGTCVKLKGSIDRVDIDGSGQVVVVDYKTGALMSERTLRKDIACGAHLQLPIYALVVRLLATTHPGLGLAGGAPFSIRLEFLKRKSDANRTTAAPQVALGPLTEPEGVIDPGAQAAEFARMFVSSIEDGHFPLARRLPQASNRTDRFDEVVRMAQDASSERLARLPIALATSEDEQ